MNCYTVDYGVYGILIDYIQHSPQFDMEVEKTIGCNDENDWSVSKD